MSQLLVSIQAERDCRQTDELTVKVILLDFSLDPEREELLEIQFSSPLLPGRLSTGLLPSNKQHSIHLCIRTAG